MWVRSVCSSFFFFSSRRRHTRWPRDWSSDVCSSDLSRHPTLRTVFERLAQTAPLWVRLCGSGAAVAATYRAARDRDDAALTLDAKLAKPIATTTRTTAAA